MVKRLLHIVFIGAVLACSDHSYRGDADAGVVEEELVPVMVVVGDPDHLIVTPSGKGQGAIDSDTKEAWEDASIYVFAFKRDLQTSFSVTSQEDSEWCLLDGSGDEMGSLAGKKARIGMLDSYVAWEGINRKIYYPQSNQPYDFYGYYIDDIPVEQEKITRTDDAVQIEVEIDGTQDLMTSKAELTDDQLYREDLTDEDRLDILNYSYSAYTAKRNIQPVMYFRCISSTIWHAFALSCIPGAWKRTRFMWIPSPCARKTAPSSPWRTRRMTAWEWIFPWTALIPSCLCVKRTVLASAVTRTTRTIRVTITCRCMSGTGCKSGVASWWLRTHSMRRTST